MGRGSGVPPGPGRLRRTAPERNHPPRVRPAPGSAQWDPDGDERGQDAG